MTFKRIRTIKGHQYEYEELRWREGGKVKSRSRIRKKKNMRDPVGGGAAGLLWGFPFRVAYDLISGNRVEELKERLSKPGWVWPHERSAARTRLQLNWAYGIPVGDVRGVVKAAYGS